jgi:hypothetical protein
MEKMRTHINTRVVGLSTILLICLVQVSCDKNSHLDFSNSWIKYYFYETTLFNSGKPINNDTITMAINDKFLFRIKTQSNDGSEPKIFKQIDDNEIIEITNIPGEATFESYYREERGYRQINKFYIDLSETMFSSGQTIKYTTRIGSLNGEIEKKLNIAIK